MFCMIQLAEKAVDFDTVSLPSNMDLHTTHPQTRNPLEGGEEEMIIEKKQPSPEGYPSSAESL